MKRILLTATIFLFACRQERLYEVNQAVPAALWNEKKVFFFSADISDTTSNCNVLVNVRHTNDYPYSNLYLFVVISSPDGNHLRDTLELNVADNTGKWYGTSTLGDIYSISKIYKKNVRFAQKGTYNFYISQAMRLTQLQGITDVGIRIEKAVNKKVTL